MTLTPEAVENGVKTYLSTLVSGTAADIAALFAEDATVEDPVGAGEVHIGRAAITRFYQNAKGAGELATELADLRVAGNEAAFLFDITVTIGEMKMMISPWEVMTFNSDGLVATMKAYWGPANTKQL